MPSATTVSDAAADAAAAEAAKAAAKPVSSIGKKAMIKARKLKPMGRSAFFLKENSKAMRRRTNALWDIAGRSPMFLDVASYDGQMTRFRLFNPESPFSRNAVELTDKRLSKALEQARAREGSKYNEVNEDDITAFELAAGDSALLAVKELSQEMRYKAAMAPVKAEAAIAALKISPEWEKLPAAKRAERVAQIRADARASAPPTRFKIKVGNVYYEPVPKSNKKQRLVPVSAIHAASSGAVAATRARIESEATEMGAMMEAEPKRAPMFLPFSKDAQTALSFGLEAIAKSAGLNALAVFEGSNAKRISAKAVDIGFRALAEKDAATALGGGFVVHSKKKAKRRAKQAAEPRARSAFISDEAGEA